MVMKLIEIFEKQTSKIQSRRFSEMVDKNWLWNNTYYYDAPYGFQKRGLTTFFAVNTESVFMIFFWATVVYLCLMLIMKLILKNSSIPPETFDPNPKVKGNTKMS